MEPVHGSRLKHAVSQTYQNSIASLIYYDNVQRRGNVRFRRDPNFSANAIYELPSPAHGWMKTLAGGWQVGGIGNRKHGGSLHFVAAGDVLGQQGTSFGAFPDVVANCNPITGIFKSNGLNYVNANCFVFPTVGQAQRPRPSATRVETTPTGGQMLCLNARAIDGATSSSATLGQC